MHCNFAISQEKAAGDKGMEVEHYGKIYYLSDFYPTVREQEYYPQKEWNNRG